MLIGAVRAAASSIPRIGKFEHSSYEFLLSVEAFDLTSSVCLLLSYRTDSGYGHAQGYLPAILPKRHTNCGEKADFVVQGGLSLNH